MVARPQSSAAGTLALLNEPDPVFKEHALKVLNTLVPQFWAEISEQITTMCVLTRRVASMTAYTPFRESLYEGDEISANAKNVAALVASKVYYFLGEYEEALFFALGAGNAFEQETAVPGSEEYVETVVCEYSSYLVPHIASDKPTAKAIDQYISMRSEDTGSKIDPRLQNIIEGIFSRCIRDGEYKQVRRSRQARVYTSSHLLHRLLALHLRRTVWTLSPRSTIKPTTLPSSHTPWRPSLTRHSPSRTVTRSSTSSSLSSHPFFWVFLNFLPFFSIYTPLSHCFKYSKKEVGEWERGK